jgi:hypothetical protein
MTLHSQPKHPAGRRRAEAALWRAAKAESRMIRQLLASCRLMAGDKQADMD